MQHVDKMKHKIKHRKIKYKKEKKNNKNQVGILIVMAVIFLIAVGFAYLSFMGLPEKQSEGAGQGNIIVPKCVDSDGGRVYGIKGSTSTRDGLLVYTDSCHETPVNPDVPITSNAVFNDINNGGNIPLYYWLREYYCSGDSIVSEYFHCPDGCIGGACSRYEDCSDSDGGKNIYVKGTVIYHGTNSTDYCDGEPQHTAFIPGTIENPVYALTEMYCENNMMQYVHLTCPGGRECKEGRCVNISNNQLRADPSSITVLIGQSTTSTISGGVVPYVISKMPDSTIASAWLSGIGGVNGYILTVSGISSGSTDVSITDSSNEDTMISIPITVNSNINNPLRAVPSSITVTVGQNTTSTISGGVTPYVISKMPDSTIASAWLRGGGLIRGYILTVYGKSAGFTDLFITDSSPEDTMISIPITVTSSACSKIGSVCRDSSRNYTDYCSSATVLNNYTCGSPGGISVDSCEMHQDDCRALRGSTGYCNNVTKQCEVNQTGDVYPDLIVYSIERRTYSNGDGLRIVVKNIDGNYGINSTLLVNVTSAGMSIYAYMNILPIAANGGNYTLDITPSDFGPFPITGKTILVRSEADYYRVVTESNENNNVLSSLLYANSCSSWNPKNFYGVNLAGLGLSAPEELGYYNLTMTFSYNGKVMSYNSAIFEVTTAIPGGHHHVCNDDYQCVQVSGPGENDCGSNSDCLYNGGGGNYTCIENWVYGAWSQCANGLEQRTCYDQRSCGTTNSKPVNCVWDGIRYVQSTSCQIGQCTEDWQCEWTCLNTGYEVRVCTDINNCGTENYKPAQESRKCGSANIFHQWYFWVALAIIVIGIVLIIIFIVLSGKRKKKEGHGEEYKLEGEVKNKDNKIKGVSEDKGIGKNEQEEQSKADSDDSGALNTYVKDAKAAGMKKEEIQEKLIGAGWPQDAVDEAIKTF